MLAPVGTSRKATLAPPRGAGAQKGRHRLWAVVLVRRWRHGQPRILGEQCDDAVDVVTAERLGEASRELPLLGRAGVRRELPRGGGAVAVERRSGAPDRALDRGRAGVEHGRDFGGREAEHITEEQGGGLARGEAL